MQRSEYVPCRIKLDKTHVRVTSPTGASVTVERAMLRTTSLSSLADTGLTSCELTRDAMHMLREWGTCHAE